MAKVKPSIIEYSGTVGREIHYTHFGRTYSHQLPAEYTDCKSGSCESRAHNKLACFAEM